MVKELYKNYEGENLGDGRSKNIRIRRFDVLFFFFSLASVSLSSSTWRDNVVFQNPLLGFISRILHFPIVG